MSIVSSYAATEPFPGTEAVATRWACTLWASPTPPSVPHARLTSPTGLLFDITCMTPSLWQANQSQVRFLDHPGMAPAH
eukprot:12908789-Prorocentrum_lima.AAC.1